MVVASLLSLWQVKIPVVPKEQKYVLCSVNYFRLFNQQIGVKRYSTNSAFQCFKNF